MRILLAVDMSACSEAAIDAVVAQYGRPGNAALVLHAVDWERHLPAPYLFAQGEAAARDTFGVRDRLVSEARAYVERAAARLRAAGLAVETDVQAEGDPRTVILDAAATWRADLIAMGSHGRSGFDRFLLGSVSERVVRHARCSVLVVRPAAPAASA